MTTLELESTLANEIMATWNKTRGINELSSFILRREVALKQVQSDELDDFGLAA